MPEKEFELSEKQSLAYYYLTDDSTTEVFFGGGAGSGKSFLGCYWQINNRIEMPGTRGLISRDQLKDIRDSTLVTFFKVCSELKLVSGQHFVFNQQTFEIYWYNKSVTVLKELKYYPSDPNYDRLGSTEYTDVLIEEAPEIQERAFDVVSTRIRWMLPQFKIQPKILITGNASDSWVKKKYVCDDEGNEVTLEKHKEGIFVGDNYQQRILATVDDNPDEEFRVSYISQLDRTSNVYDRQRLRWGDWLIKPRTGLEYFPDFDLNKHVGKPIYRDDEPLHLSFDFNSNPYMTCLLIQMKQEGGIWWVYVIDENCTPHPFNRTKPNCQKLMATPYGEHKGGGFYYGDWNGKSENTALGEEYAHQYAVIQDELFKILSQRADRTVTNKPVLKRKDLVAEILREEIPIRLLIHDRCVKTKADMLYLKENAEGTKLKQVEVERITNQKFQKYGHASDALEYFLTSAFGDYLK